jgi:hypothetical protein
MQGIRVSQNLAKRVFHGQLVSNLVVQKIMKNYMFIDVYLFIHINVPYVS